MIGPPDWIAQPRCVVGAMSGTSLDGVDAAVVRITPVGDRRSFEVLGCGSIEYSSEIRSAFSSIANSQPITIAELADLRVILMELYGEAIAAAIDHAGEQPEAIGIHGQTLWHEPTPHSRYGRVCRTTYQLADPTVLAKRFRVPVVSDVRTADVALNGQGAPLVPILDWELLCSIDEYIIALNIGGIANITLLPPSCELERLVAFDTGPGNVWIDHAMRCFWDMRYDNNGTIAASGQIIPDLFENLKTIEFITRTPPKSTGRELFSECFFDEFIAPYKYTDACKTDIITTLTAFTAWSIAENIRRYSTDEASIIVSGGGTKNSTLLSFLSSELPHSRIVRFEEHTGIPDTAKEAVLMAYLAYRTLGGLPSNIPSVTGSTSQTILGSITPP